MFAEPHYREAYERGVFAAAKVFGRMQGDGDELAEEWPFSKSDAMALVLDLSPEGDVVMARRLMTLAHAGARNEWRHRRAVPSRQSGIVPRLDMATVPRKRASRG